MVLIMARNIRHTRLTINNFSRMYKVSFTARSVSADFATCHSIEEAIQLALALHSASNIPHVVGVFSASDSCVLSLCKRSDNGK